MEMENKKLRDVAEIAAQIMMGEKALHPNQQKLDVHEPEKDELTAKDFEMLRKGKKAETQKEEVEQIEELSNATLKSYVKGAKEDKAAHTGERDSAREVRDYRVANAANAVVKKRAEGIKAAKAKMNSEEVVAEEETILEYESKDGKFVHRAKPGVYGGTKDEKHAVDTISGPKTKELKAIESEKKKKFSEELDLYKEAGIKGLFEAWAKKKAMKEAEEVKEEEVIAEEPTNAEFTAQLDDAKQRAAGTKKQAEVSKPAVQAVQNEETHTIVQVIDIDPVNGVQHSEIDLEERSLTEPEMKKKEEIVKSMKKGISGFKERYGSRAKEVMYATATARAKGE